MRGTDKLDNANKESGFIKCENLDDLFIHYSTKKGYKIIEPKDKEVFKLKKLQKQDVTKVQKVTYI